MQDVKSGDFEASIKMQTFLHALRQGINTCPVIQRSLDIITKGLRSEAVHITPAKTDHNAGGESLIGRNYLPAFPYRDFDNDFGSDPTAGLADLDGFSLLDCFPENQFDHMAEPGEWFIPT